MDLGRILGKLTIAASVLAAAIAGGLAAYAGARLIALSSARGEITAYAEDLLARATTIAQETEQSLTEVNRLSTLPCSPEDIAQLRAVAFKARFIKDVGRLVDGRFACSSFLGVLSPPAPVSSQPPDLVTETGYQLWANVALTLAPDINAMVVVAGGSNVVVDPTAFLDLDRPPFRYSIAIFNPSSKLVLRSWGTRLVTDEMMMAGNAQHANADDLLTIRCSAPLSICSVAALSRSQAVARQGTFIEAFMGFGAVAGGFLGLMVAATRRREQPLVARLHQALKSGEPTVAYQPIVDLGTGRMVSAEALIRWTDRDGNSIPPDVFVSAAEEAGTAGEITVYILRKVVSQAGRLLRENPELRITINIVVADLRDAGFYSELERCVGAAGISASQIGLELTERSSAELETAVPAIARLRKAGHRVYLDDFGTGYSSLANLQDLHVDVIKIDRAFTRTVGTSSVKVSIVPQILDMARALDLGLVVEGIETKEQLDYFAEAMPSCRGQGWFISRPLNFTQLETFYLRHRAVADAVLDRSA